MPQLIGEPRVSRGISIRLWVGATITYMVVPTLLGRILPTVLAESAGVLCFLVLSDRSRLHPHSSVDRSLARLASNLPFVLSGAMAALLGRYLLLMPVLRPF